VKIALELVQKLAQITDAALKVLDRMEGVADRKVTGSARHELHEPLCAFLENSAGIKIRFRLDDRFYQRFIHVVFLHKWVMIGPYSRPSDFDLVGARQCFPQDEGIIAAVWCIGEVHRAAAVSILIYIRTTDTG